MSGSPLEDDNKVLNVDAQANTGETAASPAVEQGAKADSPAAEKPAEKESFVDRIKKAVDGVSTEKSPTSEEGEQAVDDPAVAESKDGAAEEVKAFTKEDLPGLHSKTRKRVEKLLTTVDTVTKERDTEKAVAEIYRGQITFLKSNGLTLDDANTAFDMMKNVVNDPEKALEQLLPIVQNLQKLTGRILPEDLAKQVSDGYITEAHAKELALHRANAGRQTAQSQMKRETEDKDRLEAAQRNLNDIGTAIANWEDSWAKADPDYLKKRDEVRDLLELKLVRAQKAGKLPNGVAEAVEFAKTCRKEVENKIGKYSPAKQEMRHITGNSAATTKPKPKTMLDAISQALDG